jgi:hypothetical protein
MKGEIMDSINDESRGLCKVRKELTPDEHARLIEYVAQSTPECGMTGRERAMLYKLMWHIELSESEVASLTWESLFGADTAHELPAEVANEFEEWQEEIGAESNDSVFPNFDVTRAKEMWRKDLYNADIRMTQ